MSVPTVQESVFLSEWLAAGRPKNQLPISAVCNAHCIFCSNHLNPFVIREGIFRDIEDIKHQLTLMPQVEQPITLSESLPGRVSEGEALLHPRIFEILELIRSRFFGNRLCFTTNGALLDETFLRNLARFRPIEFTVSMHSTQPDLWARIFKRSASAARTAIASLDLIRSHQFDLVGAIVPLPAICGWDDLEKTYEYFVARGARSMILWHPGYSRRTPPASVNDLQCPLNEYLDFAERMRRRHRIPVYIGNDRRSSLGVAVRKIIRHTLKGKALGRPYRQVIWLASEAAHPRLQVLVKKYAVGEISQHEVYMVQNETYGGNISVAGLLTVDDFIRAGTQALAEFPETELILVPSAPFDTLNRDLLGIPAHRIADELGKPVWVVSNDGGYNPLLRNNFCRFDDTDGGGLVRSMQRFNRALMRDAENQAVLDLIADWPLETTVGPLSREEFSAFLGAQQQRLRQLERLEQTITQRDREHALCVERWRTHDYEVIYNLWCFLIRREGGWRIERLLWGEV